MSTDVVTKAECADIRIRIESRLTRVEVLVSLNLLVQIIALLKIFTS